MRSIIDLSPEANSSNDEPGKMLRIESLLCYVAWEKSDGNTKKRRMNDEAKILEQPRTWKYQLQQLIRELSDSFRLVKII